MATNDVGWIFSIFMIITLMGFFIPLMENELGFVAPALNLSQVTPGGTLNDTGSGELTASPVGSISGILKGLGQSYFFTFPWMWSSGFFGVLFGIFHISIRLLLVVLVYRLVRSGGG